MDIIGNYFQKSFLLDDQIRHLKSATNYRKRRDGYYEMNMDTVYAALQLQQVHMWIINTTHGGLLDEAKRHMSA
jgi:hypothetical protein